MPYSAAWAGLKYSRSLFTAFATPGPARAYHWVLSRILAFGIRRRSRTVSGRDWIALWIVLAER